MFSRLVRRFATPAVLVGVGSLAVGIGLPATGTLTSNLGWAITIMGALACLVAVPVSVRGVRLFRDESREIEWRRRSLAALRGLLNDIERRFDDVRAAVEDTPLSYYESQYLSKLEGYEESKKQYLGERGATESDAQFLALVKHYGMNENPLFSDSLRDSPAQASLTSMTNLESELPDPKLYTLLELFVEAKKRQALATIYHRLNPSRWNAYVSDIQRRDHADYALAKGIRDARRQVNQRVAQLENGARYE